MWLCRGIFDVNALLGPSEKNDNAAGFRYLSWSVSRTFSRGNRLPWLQSNSTYSPKTAGDRTHEFCSEFQEEAAEYLKHF